MSNVPFDTDLLAVYTSTRIVLEGPPPVVLAGADAIDAWPFAGHVTVLTAANPRSKRLSDDDNDLRNVALLGVLRDRGHHVTSVTASIDDWTEASFGVFELSRREARELSQMFNQHAWYELTAHEVFVISADTGEELDRRARRH
jgi:hypothetical protein